MKNKFIAYLRVSTNRQGDSGLGLEAQRSAVKSFVGSMGPEAEILKEFVEVESAKGGVQRPVLAEAVRECKANGCTLLVAKLDRLSRNLHFITALQNSKVDFVAADNPHATPFLIHILVAVAEHERNMISSRTKAALDAARSRGVVFGKPHKTVPAFVLCSTGEATMLFLPMFNDEMPPAIVIAHDDDLDEIYDDTQSNWFNVESRDMVIIAANLNSLAAKLK
jgi:hypothetical protein